jgi:hypothetical protein
LARLEVEKGLAVDVCQLAVSSKQFFDAQRNDSALKRVNGITILALDELEV